VQATIPVTELNDGLPLVRIWWRSGARKSTCQTLPRRGRRHRRHPPSSRNHGTMADRSPARPTSPGTPRSSVNERELKTENWKPWTGNRGSQRDPRMHPAGLEPATLW